MVLVDTCIWSLAVRSSRQLNGPATNELASLIVKGHALLMGAVRQEVLSGISSKAQFETLRARLRAYPDVRPRTIDYEQAAHFFSVCRNHGVQGSHVDFLICAVAHRLGTPIFTTDADFSHYARFLPIKLHRYD
jgi:hypothetical protein